MPKSIFYIDIRAPGNRYEKFYNKIKEDENVFFIKGKVAEVSEDPATGNVTVTAKTP
jgi:quinone-modifying oxidoreductase subunit QmoA